MEKGERARRGRGEPRPRGSHERSKSTNRLVIPTPRMFGARRAEQQPRRLRSPKKQLHRSGLVIIGHLVLIELKDAVLLQPGEAILAEVILQ